MTSYSYDSLNRLIEAVEENADGAVQAEWAYAYDRNGNRTLADETEYSYDAADRINQIDGEDAGLEYNDRGDLLNTPDGAQLAYGDNGALQHVTSADGETEVETLYAGETNADPFQMSIGDETVRYLSSPLGHLNEFDTQAGQEVDITRTPDGAPIALRGEDSTRYLTADHLGSTTAELDPTGAAVATHAYDPYGQDRAQAPSTFGYAAGVVNPAADLMRFGARHYTPELGTFTQIDPSGAEEAPYLYAAGNPINNTDPTGLVECELWGVLQGMLAALELFLLPLTFMGILAASGRTAAGMLTGSTGSMMLHDIAREQREQYCGDM